MSDCNLRSFINIPHNFSCDLCRSFSQQFVRSVHLWRTPITESFFTRFFFFFVTLGRFNQVFSFILSSTVLSDCNWYVKERKVLTWASSRPFDSCLSKEITYFQENGVPSDRTVTVAQCLIKTVSQFEWADTEAPATSTDMSFSLISQSSWQSWTVFVWLFSLAMKWDKIVLVEGPFNLKRQHCWYAKYFLGSSNQEVYMGCLLCKKLEAFSWG